MLKSRFLILFLLIWAVMPVQQAIAADTVGAGDVRQEDALKEGDDDKKELRENIKSAVDMASEIIDDVKNIAAAANEGDEAKALEYSIKMNRKLSVASQAVKDKVNEVLGKTYPDYEKYVGNIFEQDPRVIYSYFSRYFTNPDLGKSNVAVGSSYEMQLVSCYEHLDRSEIPSVINIIAKEGYRIVRSFEGEPRIPLGLDFSKSLNLERADIYSPNAEIIKIGDKTAFAYRQLASFPVIFHAASLDKTLDIVVEASFSLCREDGSGCTDAVGRVGMPISPGNNMLETNQCTYITNCHAAVLDEKKSGVEVNELFYAEDSGKLAVVAKASFPGVPRSAFMYVENPYGYSFESRPVEAGIFDKDVTVTAYAGGGLKYDDVKGKEMTFIIGENFMGREMKAIPPFNPDYKPSSVETPGGFLSIATVLVILLIVAGTAVLAFALHAAYKRNDMKLAMRIVAPYVIFVVILIFAFMF